MKNSNKPLIFEYTPFYEYDYKQPVTSYTKEGKKIKLNPITRDWNGRLRPNSIKELNTWKGLGCPKFKVFLPYQIKPEVLRKKLTASQILETQGITDAPFVTKGTSNIKETDLFFILYTIHRYGYKKDNKGFVQLPTPTLQSYINNRYKVAIQFLVDYKYIIPKNGNLKKGYHNGSRDKSKNKCRSFKINPRYYTNNENLSMKAYDAYDDVWLQNKLQLKSITNSSLRKIKETHKNLALMVDEISIDEEAFQSYVKKHPEKFIDKDISRAYMAIDRINNGITCKLDQDLFGERFFCDLSSILGEARKFTHNGDYKYYKAIDLKSSQFFFWTQLLNPEVIKEFLIKREPNKHLKKHYQKFSNDMKLIKDNKDIKLFQSAVKEGTLYDRLANRLNITRKEAKNEYFFPASFSKYNVNKPLKYEIAKDYPSFVKLVNDTNNINTPKLVPSILQKVESRILLDEVAVDLFNTLENLEEKYPFFTVHDAFYIHPDVYDLCLKTIKDSFIRLGLDVPIMSN